MTGRVCTRCVMDESDREITFDEAGHCNHCTELLETLRQTERLREAGYFEALVERTRERTSRRPNFAYASPEFPVGRAATGSRESLPFTGGDGGTIEVSVPLDAVEVVRLYKA